MVVGVAIALVQALTQIQEITLTFVPKIVAILLVVAFSGPFIGSQISSFSNVVLSGSSTVSDEFEPSRPVTHVNARAASVTHDPNPGFAQA